MAGESTTSRDAVSTPANEWRTVRCENEQCRHIVFKFRRDAALAGSVVIQVKCRCKTMNNVRIGANVN